ncbi:MAG: Fe-S protein assembly co-chaperone HscB [Proteobacteria bacterium]|nr:Fe-S protein assembly co-chaperone HscB [Pseudomonadota bacterium]
MNTAADDYFLLFGLERTMAIELAELTQRYHRLQSEFHPDRFAGATSLQRQAALQHASRINDAYATLKKPLSRAAYLVSLYGVDVHTETDTAMPVDFLMQQLEWREALEEADDDTTRAALRSEISRARDSVVGAATAALAKFVAAGSEGQESQEVYDLLRRWIYLEKLMAPENFSGNLAK